MSKKNTEGASIKDAVIEEQTNGKTVEELKETAENLLLQLKQEQSLFEEEERSYQVSSQRRRSRVLKLSGGFEVTVQLLPEKEMKELMQKIEEENNN